jgi:hypothetical protein
MHIYWSANVSLLTFIQWFNSVNFFSNYVYARALLSETISDCILSCQWSQFFRVNYHIDDFRES